MYEFTEAIRIEASPSRVWEVMSDIEDWRRAANPERERVELLDRSGVRIGARVRIRSEIAGMPGEAVGVITVVRPGSAVTLEVPEAHYRWHGIPITVSEGVAWAIEPREEGASARVSARTWVRFPLGLLGAAIQWAFVRPLNGIERDRERTRTELRDLKRLSESGSPVTRSPC